MNALLRVDGTVLMGHEGCRERLAEYFEELYNVPAPADRLAGGTSHAVAPDSAVKEDPSSYQEVETVISELKLSCWGLWGPHRAAQDGLGEHDAEVMCCISTRLVHWCCLP